MKRRVLLTRSSANNAELKRALEGAGMEVVEVPLVETRALVDRRAILSAVPQHTDGVVFTSKAAARLVVGALGSDSLGSFKIATVGDGTAEPLIAAGLTVSLVSSRHDAQGLAEEIVETGWPCKRVWFPCAVGAGRQIPEILGAHGIEVFTTAIYDTLIPGNASDRLRLSLGKSGFDVVVLASSSAGRNLVEAAAGLQVLDWHCVCIGDSTAETAREVGFRKVAVASSPDTPGLLAAVKALKYDPA